MLDKFTVKELLGLIIALWCIKAAVLVNIMYSFRIIEEKIKDKK